MVIASRGSGMGMQEWECRRSSQYMSAWVHNEETGATG